MQRSTLANARSQGAAAMGAPIAAICAFLSIAMLAWLSCFEHGGIAAYVLTLSLGCVIVTALLWHGASLSAVHVLAVALALHAIAALGSVPWFEDDWYRFAWDGWRTLQTGTPYGASPADFYGDTAIPPPWAARLGLVNNPEVPTIYGPVLQALFALIVWLGAGDASGFRVLFAGANLLLIAAMLRRLPPARVALYAWNPLVIAETVLHAHPDALVALPMFAALALWSRKPLVAAALLGLAAGVKLVALVLWPLLLRGRPLMLMTACAILAACYLPFLLQGAGIGLDGTGTFAAQWHFNALLFDLLLAILPPLPARLAAMGIAALLVLWLHARASGPGGLDVAAIFGVVLLCAPAVNPWYLIWLLPFAAGQRRMWPLAAATALPLAYLTAGNLGNGAVDPFTLHPAARIAELAIIAAAIIADWRRGKAPAMAFSCTAIPAPNIAVIIPALNEEAAITGVVRNIRALHMPGPTAIFVIDNGSTDSTAALALAAGARVVPEPVRGYGRACLAGIAALPPAVNIVLFMDADGSDVESEALALLAPVIAGDADMVIGSRRLGRVDRGAMSAPQRFGNWLAPALIRLIWDLRYTDLGPFRAIRRDALERLMMADEGYGWTVEMQVRAARLGMAIAEMPADYRRRIGTSKISGTLRGVIGAGTKILYVIAREAFFTPLHAAPSSLRKTISCAES